MKIEPSNFTTKSSSKTFKRPSITNLDLKNYSDTGHKDLEWRRNEEVNEKKGK